MELGPRKSYSSGNKNHVGETSEMEVFRAGDRTWTTSIVWALERDGSSVPSENAMIQWEDHMKARTMKVPVMMRVDDSRLYAI